MRWIMVAALVMAAACGDEPTVAPTAGARALCPVSFDWHVLNAATDYEQTAIRITGNDYRMVLRPDSLVSADGGLYVDMEIRVGLERDTVEYVVLWPFTGKYREEDKVLVIREGQIWLTRSDVVHTFDRDGSLETTSLDPVVELVLRWGRC